MLLVSFTNRAACTISSGYYGRRQDDGDQRVGMQGNGSGEFFQVRRAVFGRRGWRRAGGGLGSWIRSEGRERPTEYEEQALRFDGASLGGVVSTAERGWLEPAKERCWSGSGSPAMPGSSA